MEKATFKLGFNACKLEMPVDIIFEVSCLT